MSNRTDIACEFAQNSSDFKLNNTTKTINGVNVFEVNIDDNAAQRCGKPVGRYITLSCEYNCDEIISKVLADYIAEMLEEGSVMVVGLGNPDITPDSLGAKTVRKIVPTSHLARFSEFEELNLRSVSVIEAGVLARTGIESSDRLKYLVNGVKPNCVIVVDSLACSEANRLCSTIQLTDSGIAPGSGVANSRKSITSEKIGVRVIAVGVPTVIDYDNTKNMVTPRDIDAQIRRFANIISSAINSALNPTLTEEDISALMM